MAELPSGFDVDDFLARYWQRRPLLIPAAIPAFSPPLSADELAGLAMEDAVESRLVQQSGSDWPVVHGPFAETDFQRPGAWTLLVQAVDQLIPEVAQLRGLVNFLPDWRADDIMVSYATDGGSVGPHFDHYDVFLLQGEGKRLWRLGQSCDHTTPLVPDQALRILRHFDCQQEYLLGPGDILYVPPGLAHWGIAQGECTTFSIGFRAPRRQDMLARRVDQALEELAQDVFFTDPGRAASARPGELSDADLERAQQQLNELLKPTTAAHWFGELITEPSYTPDPEQVEPADIDRLLSGRSVLCREPGAKLAWRQDAGVLNLYANGATLVTDPAYRDPIITLCESGQLACSGQQGSEGLPSLLTFLLQTGSCYVQHNE